MITTVAFDLGGVLTYTSFGGLEDYGARLGLPAGTLTGYFHGHPKMVLLETGQISSREFFKFVCIDTEQRTGTQVNIRALAAAAAKGEELNPAMLDLVIEVRGRARTALLTNNVAEATWRASFPFTSFDIVVDSSEVGLRKPDPRIYAELLHRASATPAELIFIDDLPENIDAATDLGINGHRFTDIEGLRSFLADFNLLN